MQGWVDDLGQPLNPIPPASKRARNGPVDEEEMREAIEILSAATTSKALQKIRKPALVMLASSISQHVPTLAGSDHNLLTTLNKKALTEMLFEVVSIYIAYYSSSRF